MGPTLQHRRHIRETTVALLQAAQTFAADRIYPTAILPWRRERPLPAIGVYTLDEAGTAVEGGHSGPLGIEYALELRIEIVVETESAADQTPDARMRIDSAALLDGLCDQVTEALLPSVPFRALIEAVSAWSTKQEPARAEDSDRRTMAATITGMLRYTCWYEPVITDDLCGVRLQVDVIDPAADPNTTGHPTTPPDGYPGGYPGPEGRIEVDLTIPRPGIDPPLCDDDPHARGVVGQLNGSERSS
jgi:hypothetical protein